MQFIQGFCEIVEIRREFSAAGCFSDSEPANFIVSGELAVFPLNTFSGGFSSLSLLKQLDIIEPIWWNNIVVISESVKNAKLNILSP